MHSVNMSKKEKLEWVHWYLHDILRMSHQFGNIIDDANTLIAIQFIEDIRDSYIQDYK